MSFGTVQYSALDAAYPLEMCNQLSKFHSAAIVCTYRVGIRVWPFTSSSGCIQPLCFQGRPPTSTAILSRATCTTAPCVPMTPTRNYFLVSHAGGDPRADACTHAVDLCDSSGSSAGSGDDTESDAEMRLGFAAGSGGGSDATALPDPDGMYARATKGNLVEKSPGKCADCAKKLDKNWFRCGSVA